MKGIGMMAAIVASAALLFTGQAYAQVDPDPEIEAEAMDDMAMDDISMGVVTMEIALSGDAVRPAPVVAEAGGTVTLTIDRVENLVCYTFGVDDLEIASAHIHSGAEGEAGPVALGLVSEAGMLEGCVDADPEVIESILADPESYYVQGHNADHPAGVVRGQLSIE